MQIEWLVEVLNNGLIGPAFPETVGHFEIWSVSASAGQVLVPDSHYAQKILTLF